MRKKSQVAIFIILALIIIILLIIFLILKNSNNTIAINKENPHEFIDKCLKESLDESVKKIGQQGGSLEPQGFTTYNNESINYICYNEQYYQPCINQKPLLIKDIQDDLNKYIEPKITSCFNKLEKELEKKYQIKSSEGEFHLTLKRGYIEINIKRTLSISDEESSINYDEFTVKYSTPLYELAKLAIEISNQEAGNCNFDIFYFMLLYPDYKIEKLRPGDQDIIYILNHRDSEQEFRFAIKSCPLPPGF